MKVILEQPKSKWDLEKIKEYISKFEFKKDFYKDSNFNSINAWIFRRNKNVGPDGEQLTLTDLLKGLKTTQGNEVTDEEYKERLNQKFPKEKYPYWDFSNVTFRFDNNTNRVLDGLYCSKTDKNGQVHGTTDGYRMSDLLSPTKESGCRKCAEEKKSGLKVDFEEYVENFPKDRGYDFSQSTLIPSPPEKTVKPRAFVKNVYCTKVDKYDKPHGLFAKDGVDIFNLLHNKTGCPKCRRNRYKGPASIIKTLVELGYDEDNIDFEWTIEGCISPKSRECRKYPLYFDIRIVDKNGKQILIEYDGIQHFEANPKRGGEEKFENDIINDKRKNIFTKENNLKLIRIAYTDFKKINDEVIKGLASPNQLYLSSTYPKLGWNDSKLTIPIQVTESKIKKDYILTESQLRRIIELRHELLSEYSLMGRLKRMVNKESFEKYIIETQEEFPDICGDFVDEYEYSSNIIAMAIEHFFAVNEDYFTESSYEDFIDKIFIMCRGWYGDDLMETYFTACVDDNMMNEAFDTNLEPNKVIVKLFKILNTQKSNYKTKVELEKAIKDYLPHFGIDEYYATYILEVYLLNYRQDGDYSSLTKDNFIDPRTMKGKRTPNYNAKVYTKVQLPFEGANLRGFWRTTIDGKIYVVESYGWYPVYIFKDGKWYENSDRYSSSTGKQMNASQPYRWNDTLKAEVYLLTRREMGMLERGATHEEVMKQKREAFKELAPSLVSQKTSTTKSSSYAVEPKISVKFKISSVEEIDDKNVVNVDIQDVLKIVDGKQVPTPENYLKGEIPNVTPEKVEKQIEIKLRNNLRDYLGPKFDDKPEEDNIIFRFNHLKK